MMDFVKQAARVDGLARRVIRQIGNVDGLYAPFGATPGVSPIFWKRQGAATATRFPVSPPGVTA